MIRFIFSLALLLFAFSTSWAQHRIKYDISFEKAALHEAEVQITFTDLPDNVLEARMSRTSPGRYAVHEFAKNVYNVQAEDGKGNALKVYRANPYQWNIAGHDGTVKLTYTLFADHADGTYTGIDESHAHMNIPATFMYARGLEDRPVEVTFHTRDDLNWKVATQLKPLQGNTYYAPDLYYFMDSPTELSDFDMRSWTVNSNGKEYTIRMAMHHDGTPEEVDQYVEWTKAIVEEQKAVFGALPDYDFGTYTFIVCYLPHVAGDGMEHRNSTIVTSTRPLASSAKSNIGTVSHEFFHCWNVERIRPKSLEPFNFEEANMSGELWFAEGFTSYYDDLTLCRAGVFSPKEYAEGLRGTLNYVLLYPGRQYFNPIEMSYQAPFVDAATSVDPVNRQNTFISYYSYGSVIGLVLDLQLRDQFKDKTLDGFMAYMWEHFGKPEYPYSVKTLEAALGRYTGDEAFADAFFNQYIYQSELPDMEALLATMGIRLEKASPDKATIGVNRFDTKNDQVILAGNALKGTPAYEAGLGAGDVILAVNGEEITSEEQLRELIESKTPGETLEIRYKQRGNEKSTALTLVESPWLKVVWEENPSKKVRKQREEWLSSKAQK